MFLVLTPKLGDGFYIYIYYPIISHNLIVINNLVVITCYIYNSVILIYFYIYYPIF
jgi:hypothetical protein